MKISNRMYYLVPESAKLFSKEVNLFTPRDIYYMRTPIISYALASIEIILITMMISGKKLKYPKGNLFDFSGLIDGLVFGLIFGLVFGFRGGLVSEFEPESVTIK
jgi:hypothetical protein